MCGCYETWNRCICANPWEIVTDRTTNSGQTLFRCICRGYETPAPTKNHKCEEVCGICEGRCVVDSGGVTSWGAGIDVRCGYCAGTGEEPNELY